MYKFFKRTLDIVLSFIGMIVLSPFFLLLVLAIKLDSKGPVLFKQKRIGLHKKHFYILKFRTMRIDTPKDTPTHLLENPEQWITKVGKFLRKTSLDELPQIWNIFVGDMSIIVQGRLFGISMIWLKSETAMELMMFCQVWRDGLRFTGEMSCRLPRKLNWTATTSSIYLLDWMSAVSLAPLRVWPRAKALLKAAREIWKRKIKGWWKEY